MGSPCVTTRVSPKPRLAAAALTARQRCAGVPQPLQACAGPSSLHREGAPAVNFSKIQAEVAFIRQRLRELHQLPDSPMKKLQTEFFGVRLARLEQEIEALQSPPGAQQTPAAQAPSS